MEGEGTYKFSKRPGVPPKVSLDDLVKGGAAAGAPAASTTVDVMYVGQWHDDKMQGHGTAYYADGEAELLQFDHGEKRHLGARFSSDGKEMWKLKDGSPVKKVRRASAPCSVPFACRSTRCRAAWR